MDNKAGILTFHYADNYGAVLQAMSLRDYISTLGMECNIINYFPKYARANNRMILLNSARYLVVSLLNIPSKVMKRVHFNHFRKFYLKWNKTTYCSYDNLVKVIGDYDMIVFGSDQIWNPSLTGGLDKAYFGAWNNSNKQIKIAYAASIGISKLTENETSKLQEFSGYLNAIGIREPEVENFVNRKATVVCDPVFLNDANYWNNVFNAIKPIHKPYILVYSLSGYPEVYKLAGLIKRKTGLEVIEIRAGYRISKQIEGEKIFKSKSPEEFVGYIKNADYVVTDSFHGTAFSIIFNKNFFVVPNKTKGSRMIYLLERVGLSNRIIKDKDILDNIDITLYDTVAVNQKLSQFRDESRSFLKQAIRN